MDVFTVFACDFSWVPIFDLADLAGCPCIRFAKIRCLFKNSQRIHTVEYVTLWLSTVSSVDRTSLFLIFFHFPWKVKLFSFSWLQLFVHISAAGNQNFQIGDLDEVPRLWVSEGKLRSPAANCRVLYKERKGKKKSGRIKRSRETVHSSNLTGLYSREHGRCERNGYYPEITQLIADSWERNAWTTREIRIGPEWCTNTFLAREHYFTRVSEEAEANYRSFKWKIDCWRDEYPGSQAEIT